MSKKFKTMKAENGVTLAAVAALIEGTGDTLPTDTEIAMIEGTAELPDPTIAELAAAIAADANLGGTVELPDGAALLPDQTDPAVEGTETATKADPTVDFVRLRLPKGTRCHKTATGKLWLTTPLYHGRERWFQLYPLPSIKTGIIAAGTADTIGDGITEYPALPILSETIKAGTVRDDYVIAIRRSALSYRADFALLAEETAKGTAQNA